MKPCGSPRASAAGSSSPGQGWKSTGYFEEDTEIKLDSAGGEEEREARVYVVSPAANGREPDSRLVSVNGKPPSEDELEEDEERREGDREDVESKSKSASQRRREAVEDLRRGLVVKIDGRKTVDGQRATILSFEPRPGAHLQSRVGRFIRAMRGRVWATDAGDVVRVEARLDSDVSVGWGLIARVWQGSWLRVKQQPHDGSWLPRDLTAEAQGRTLLFRTFRTRYAVGTGDTGSGPRRNLRCLLPRSRETRPKKARPVVLLQVIRPVGGDHEARRVVA